MIINVLINDPLVVSAERVSRLVKLGKIKSCYARSVSNSMNRRLSRLPKYLKQTILMLMAKKMLSMKEAIKSFKLSHIFVRRIIAGKKALLKIWSGWSDASCLRRPILLRLPKNRSNVSNIY